MAYRAAIKKDVEIDSTQQDSYGIVKWKKVTNSMYNLIPIKKMYKCTEKSGRLYT